MMNAYLFAAGVTRSETRPLSAKAGPTMATVKVWDSCLTQIVAGSNPEEARNRFEAWLTGPAAGDTSFQVEIKKVVATQFVGQLLAEEGAGGIDWLRVCQEAAAILEATPADDFEQGYWVDVNEVIVGPGQAGPDIETLQRDLPEDLRCGLNWSPEKTFLFLVSVLSPPAPVPDPVDEWDTDAPTVDEEENVNEREVPLDPSVAALPDLLDKEAVALVKARNSVVAAWLWQKFAAGTPLAGKRIQISPWCGAIGFEPAPEA